jgi:hypothetical protein
VLTTGYDLAIKQFVAGTFEPRAVSLGEFGRTYLIVRTADGPRLWMLNDEGEQVFDARLPEDASDTLVPPIVTGDHRVFVVTDTRIVAFSPMGDHLWEFVPSRGRPRAVTTAEGWLLVAVDDAIGVLDAEGRAASFFRLPGEVFRTAPVVTPAGEVIAATERSLVALSQQPPPLMDSEPFYPLAGADALYEPLPLLTPASYDAPSRTLRCVTPAIWPAENAAQTDAPSIRLRLEVSANGQQYTSDGVEFLMHAGAVLSQFTPSGGPAAGGTAIRITGFGLADGSEYVCRAGAARVLTGGRMDYGTGQLHCTMPSHAACEPAGTEIGMSAVAVSTNGQQFSADFFFEFAAPATVSRITPAAGPQLGGILVQVQGANLRAGHAISGSALPALSCRFGETSVPATFENASASVLCTSPAPWLRANTPSPSATMSI